MVMQPMAGIKQIRVQNAGVKICGLGTVEESPLINVYHIRPANDNEGADIASLQGRLTTLPEAIQREEENKSFLGLDIF